MSKSYSEVAMEADKPKRTKCLLYDQLMERARNNNIFVEGCGSAQNAAYWMIHQEKMDETEVRLAEIQVEADLKKEREEAYAKDRAERKRLEPERDAQLLEVFKTVTSEALALHRSYFPEFERELERARKNYFVHYEACNNEPHRLADYTLHGHVVWCEKHGVAIGYSDHEARDGNVPNGNSGYWRGEISARHRAVVPRPVSRHDMTKTKRTKLPIDHDSICGLPYPNKAVSPVCEYEMNRGGHIHYSENHRNFWCYCHFCDGQNSYSHECRCSG